MAKHEPIPKEVEHWGKALLDAAFVVHTILGAGFLERVYEDASAHGIMTQGTIPRAKCHELRASLGSLPQRPQRNVECVKSLNILSTLGVLCGFHTSSHSTACPVRAQKAVVVPYKDIQIEGQRLDLLIGGLVIAEIKAGDDIHPIHEAQLMSYLKATGLRLGFVINFNVPHLKEGICRVVL